MTSSSTQQTEAASQRALPQASRSRWPTLLAVWLAGVVPTSSLLAQPQSDAEPPARPNIVLVLADDVGFSDFGTYGSEIRTPNIDALAANGVKFSNFHASPMCSPSRAMLLTGVDSHTAGVANLYEATPLRHRGKPGYEGVLRGDVVTLATRLQGHGYRTYRSGKWNLGHTQETLPSARGFDRTFALDATGADNFEKRPYLPFYDEVPWFADGLPTDLPDDFYSSEFLVDKLVEFIGTDRQASSALETAGGTETPFFAYLAFQAIHIPIQAPREFIQRYEGTYDEGWEVLRESRYLGAVASGVVPPATKPSTEPAQTAWDTLPDDQKRLFAKSMAVNAAMLESMDHNLGRLLSYLKQEDLYQNTIFVVLSDNGPEAANPAQSRLFRRWLDAVGYRRDLVTLGEKGSYAFIGPDFARATASPLAYYKFHGGEGGLRVPLIFSGPSIEARGSTSAFSFITDITPTLLQLADVPNEDLPGKKQIVGRSLVPLLQASAEVVHAPDQSVAFETAGHAGVFRGDYKLVRVGAPAGDRQWRLFHLRNDPGETQDLSASEPDLLAAMLSDYQDYAEKVGVLEVPSSYSPPTQLAINHYYDQAKDNLGLVLLVALGAVLFLAAFVLLLRRLRQLQQGRSEISASPKSRKIKGLRLKKILFPAAAILAALLLTVGLALPSILRGLGLHAHYEIPTFDLEGRRALIVTTSHDTLGATGRATGVWASEFTVPYYAFIDAGMQVDVASIKGGEIPIDPQSLRWPVVSEAEKRYLDDPELRSKVEQSQAISGVVAEDYDIVFLAGGWGAAYDFGQSVELGDKVSSAYADLAIVGGVCHGPLGLLKATAPSGAPLVAGRRLSAASDKQIQELGIDLTPMHPERDLRNAGAVFEAETKFRDIFATHVVVDGRLVTGQNQNSGAETAHRMMEALLGVEATRLPTSTGSATQQTPSSTSGALP